MLKEPKCLKLTRGSLFPLKRLKTKHNTRSLRSHMCDLHAQEAWLLPLVLSAAWKHM